MPNERALHSNISKAVPTLKKQQHSVISTRTVLCILGRVRWEKSQFCHQVVTHIFHFSHLSPLPSPTTTLSKKENCGFSLRIGLCAHNRFSVTPFFPWPEPFFILLEISKQSSGFAFRYDTHHTRALNPVYVRHLDPSVLPFSL